MKTFLSGHATHPDWRVALALAAAQIDAARAVAGDPLQPSLGWVYLTERASTWNEAERKEMGAEIDQALEGLLCSGAICAWLAPGGIAKDVVAADGITREAGLGAMTPAEESAVVTQFLGEAREHLARLGVTIGDFRSRVAVPS